MGRYNDRIRGLKGKKGKRQFLQLYKNVKESKPYHSLSPMARALLFELIGRYTGINNGMIGLGVREAAYELGRSIGTAATAMRELDDSGLVRALTPGAWRGKKATEWRLMWLRCDKTGDLPVSVWERRHTFAEYSYLNTKVQLAEHRERSSSARYTQKPNSSMNDESLSSAHYTHIDIYQGPGETAELTEEGAEVAESLSKAESNQGASNKVGLSANPKITSKSKKGAA